MKGELGMENGEWRMENWEEGFSFCVVSVP